MARLRGAQIIAAAGQTFADDLGKMGAEVTPYGDGMVDRVRAIAGGAPDLIFDAGPISDVLPDLVRIAGGDAHRIVTVSNHGPAATALGVRDSFGKQRYDVLAEFAKLAAGRPDTDHWEAMHFSRVSICIGRFREKVIGNGFRESVD